VLSLSELSTQVPTYLRLIPDLLCDLRPWTRVDIIGCSSSARRSQRERRTLICARTYRERLQHESESVKLRSGASVYVARCMLRCKWWRFPKVSVAATLRQPQRQHNAQRTTHNCAIAAAIECSAAGEVISVNV
jgi:hypothetical protein